MGCMYQMGKGVAHDYAEALKWYRASADLGYTIALCQIGKLYLEGRGVEKNFEKALNIISKPPK